MAQFYRKEIHPQDNVSAFRIGRELRFSILIGHAAFLSAKLPFQMDLYQRLCTAWS